jgi:hypothetical protein
MEKGHIELFQKLYRVDKYAPSTMETETEYNTIKGINLEYSLA